jgi:aminoglycoside 6'-N-acetyltransferase
LDGNRWRVSLRPLCRSDFTILLDWLNAPHVREWWGPAPSAERVETKYTPRVDWDEPVHCLIASVNEQSVGMIQWYRTGDVDYGYPALRLSPLAIAMDIFIGEARFLGRGLGSAIVQRLIAELGTERAPYYVIDPDAANDRAIRSYQRAGFCACAKVSKDNKVHLIMWKH